MQLIVLRAVSGYRDICDIYKKSSVLDGNSAVLVMARFSYSSIDVSVLMLR